MEARRLGDDARAATVVGWGKRDSDRGVALRLPGGRLDFVRGFVWTKFGSESARNGAMDSDGPLGRRPKVGRSVPAVHNPTGDRTREATEHIPPGLLRHRVAVPGQAVDHLHRPALVKRCMPTSQRVTLLKAPGGFGKTALLAECCRELSRQGVPTAWLALDEHDEQSVVEAYLEFAFRIAGVDLIVPTQSGESRADSPWQRIGLLLRAIEDYGAPCVLALDELENLESPDSVALVNFLVQRGPPGLHLAMTCRELPAGLNVASAVLEGRAEILTADELRFSNAEIAQYFDLKLSRRELAAVASDSAGWPVALRIYRNEGGTAGRGEARVVKDVIENWVESRLLAGVGQEERDLLLDLGLFGRIDAALLDEVFERTDSAGRVDGMSWLFGLLDPVRGAGPSVWRLHPLVRDLCAKLRRRDSPERYRAIHRRIAIARSRRGETVPAMRHAAKAEDPALVARILLDAGGARLWLREGVDRLSAADRLLTEESVVTLPRLALARCVVFTLTGRLPEARRLFETVPPSGGVAAGVPDGDSELQVDYCLVRGLIALYGCEPLSSERSRQAASDYARLADVPAGDPVVRGIFEYGSSIVHNLKAEFDVALEWGARARQRVRRRSRYLTMLIDFQMGQVAMAQGRVQDAAELYRRGRQISRDNFPGQPHPAAFGRVLTRELNLERNRMMEGEPAVGVPSELYQSGTPLALYAAAAGVESELALRTSGADGAIAVVDDMWEHARRTELSALARYLSALSVSVLARAGRVGEASHRWRSSTLPAAVADCLDLDGQTWREMEALSCARVRLLMSEGELEAGRRLTHGLIEVAATRGLKRTLMRALVLAMALEEQGGDRDAACAHLARFLPPFAETGYALAPVSDARVFIPVLQTFLDTDPDTPVSNVAGSLMSALSHRGADVVPQLTTREEEVLQRLEMQHDKEIAAAMGLTPDGVRYHIRKLFMKLKAHDRATAVRRARTFGMLPPAT